MIILICKQYHINRCYSLILHLIHPNEPICAFAATANPIDDPKISSIPVINTRSWLYQNSHKVLTFYKFYKVSIVLKVLMMSTTSSYVEFLNRMILTYQNGTYALEDRFFRPERVAEKARDASAQLEALHRARVVEKSQMWIAGRRKPGTNGL